MKYLILVEFLNETYNFINIFWVQDRTLKLSDEDEFISPSFLNFILIVCESGEYIILQMQFIYCIFHLAYNILF